MTRLAPAKVPFEDGAFLATAVTGGTIFPQDSEAGFSPVKSYAGGNITVIGFVDRLFLRGDANGDSRVDLSDAVMALGHLFLGNVGLACVDAADTDDSGVVEITDAIFLLGALFLGTKSVPEPYPTCGKDLTRDPVGCRVGCP